MWHFLTRLFARRPSAMVYDLEHERLRRLIARDKPGDDDEPGCPFGVRTRHWWGVSRHGGGAMAFSREDAMRRTERK